MPLSRSRYSIALLNFTFLMSFSTPTLLSADKPPLTLDEFFDAVHIREIEISPDGESVVIETERADWNASILRHDLWLYRAAGPGSSSSGIFDHAHPVGARSRRPVVSRRPLDRFPLRPDGRSQSRSGGGGRRQAEGSQPALSDLASRGRAP